MCEWRLKRTYRSAAGQIRWDRLGDPDCDPRLADQRYVEQMQSRYATIDIPVMVCWGEDDAWVPADRGRELAQRIPDARLETLPCAGHLVQEDSPAELTAVLLAFLHDLA